MDRSRWWTLFVACAGTALLLLDVSVVYVALPEIQASPLAQAHALDRGWDRVVMEAAARDAAARLLGDGAFSELQLVQVIDKPGKDEDQAVYRVQTADGGEHRITLGRTGDVWGPA